MKNTHILFLVSLLLIGFGSLLTPKAEASRGFSNSSSYLPNGYYDYSDDCIRYAFDRNCGRSYDNNLNNGYRYSGYNNGYNGYTNYGYYNNYDDCTRYAFSRNCGNTSYYNNSSSYNGYYNNYDYVKGYYYDSNLRYNYNDGRCNYYRC